MQDTRHPIRRALETQEAANARRVSALPPVKDPEMQAWLSPLSVSAVDRAPPSPTVSRIQSGNTMRGVGMSAVGALAVAVLTYSMLPRGELPTTPDLLAASAVGLEESVVPAAGGGATATELADAAGLEEIERLLQRIAFAPGKIDGYLDSATENAIMEFEKAAGREPTGQPTVALLEELRAVSFDLGSD